MNPRRQFCALGAVLLLLAGCASVPEPPAGRPRPADTPADTTEGIPRGAGARTSGSPPGLAVSVRTEGGDPVVLALAVPCGALHGAAAIALSELRADPFARGIEALGGVAEVLLLRDETVFLASLPREAALSGVGILLDLLDEEAAPRVTGDHLLVSRARVPRFDLAPDFPEDAQRLEGGCYRHLAGFRRPALASVGPLSEADLRRRVRRQPAPSGQALPPGRLPRTRHAAPRARPAHFELSLPAPSTWSAEGMPTALLAEILNGPSGARIATSSGVEEPVVEHVAGADGGWLRVRGSATGELPESAYGYVETLSSLATDDIPPEELARARERLVTRQLRRLSSRSTRAVQLAAEAAAGFPQPLGARLQALRTASREDVVAAALRDRGDRFQFTVWGVPDPSFLVLEDLPRLWSQGTATAGTEHAGTPLPGWQEPGSVVTIPLREDARALLVRDANLPLLAISVRLRGGLCDGASPGLYRLLAEAASRTDRGELPEGVRPYAGRQVHGFDLLAPAEQATAGAGAILDRLRNPDRITEEALVAAKRRIAEDTRFRQQDPASRSQDLMWQGLYPGDGCGAPPGGRAVAVARAQAGDLPRPGTRTQPGAPAVRIAIAGDLPLSRMRAIAEAWGAHASARLRRPEISRPEARQATYPADRTWLSVGFLLEPERSAAAEVLAEVLTEEGGPLDLSLVQWGERGSRAFVEGEGTLAAFVVQVAAPAGGEADLEPAILDALSRVATGAVSEPAVRRAKLRAETRAAARRTDLGALAAHLVRFATSGTASPSSVRGEDLTALARELQGRPHGVGLVQGAARSTQSVP